MWDFEGRTAVVEAIAAAGGIEPLVAQVLALLREIECARLSTRRTLQLKQPYVRCVQYSCQSSVGVCCLAVCNKSSIGIGSYCKMSCRRIQKTLPADLRVNPIARVFW